MQFIKNNRKLFEIGFVVIFLMLIINIFSLNIYAQEIGDCKDMTIKDVDVKVCPNLVNFSIGGNNKEVTLLVIEKEDIRKLINNGVYILPLSLVGYDENKAPKTFLVTYENNSCIDSNEITFDGLPTDKKQICFCELDFDRNIADLEDKFLKGNESDLGISKQFLQNNRCDIYIPNSHFIPVNPSVTPKPTEPISSDISQCLIYPDAQNISAGNFLFPLIVPGNPNNWDGVVVSQWFGNADGSLGYTQHTGIDLAYGKGTPVVAVKDGIVEAVLEGWNFGYGNLIIIKHLENGKKYYSYYPHLSAFSITSGQNVRTGQKIGEVGTTGNSTGNHLHYEIRSCPTPESTRSECKAFDPKLFTVFSKSQIGSPTESIPIYDQECVDKIKEEQEKLIGNYKPGEKFECMFKYAADTVDNITPEAIYAIAKLESASSSFDYFICPKTWDSWMDQGDRKQCLNSPLEIAFGSRNGYNDDPSIDVRGLTQFQATTFSNLVKNNKLLMDYCIDRLGGKSTFEQGTESYDEVISSELRSNYSRHVVSHMICATAIKLKQDSVNFKKRLKEETGTGFNYKFSDDSIYLSKTDWNEIVIKNLTAKLNFYNGDNSISHTQDFNALDYVGHRYHGSCRKDVAMPGRNGQSYYDAYCKRINNFYIETYNSKLFEGCGNSGDKSEATQLPVEEIETTVKIEAQFCSASCTNCKYFPVSKNNSLKTYYSPEVETVPDDILKHQITDPTTNQTYVPQLTKETIDNMRELFSDAKTNGVNLAIRTAYRSYKYQNKIFFGDEEGNGSGGYIGDEMRKSPGISRNEAIKLANVYSALPGQSEHQLGTTADVTCAECQNTPFTNDSKNIKVYEYLANNSYKFGFIVSYTTQNESITGFKPEGWHIRYIGKDLAAEYMKEYNKLNGKFSLDQFFINKCER